MKPVIVIVGRQNVGKSTLFNALTRTRDALVADEPGLTRDRQYGSVVTNGVACLLVDTGGLGERDDAITEHITDQALLAIQEADAALFMVDGRAGLTAADEWVADQLRRLNRPVHLVINKTEGLDGPLISADFYRMGFDQPHLIAAAHGVGLHSMMRAVLKGLPPADEELATENRMVGIKVAIIGRPNVGKSTLVNRMLGEDRVITFDQPGTTRDSIAIPFERDHQHYTLIDTAGVRRRAKVKGTIEKFSVVKTLQAIEQAHVVLLVLDAREGITEQDKTLLGLILESGRGVVIAVNKWDGLEKSERQRIRRELDRKLHFIDFADIHFISALHGTGVGNLFIASKKVWRSATVDLSTAELTNILQDAVAAHPPPLVRGRRIKLRYAHQGGRNPLRVVVHGNQTVAIPTTYQRYLMNTFRQALDLTGTPIRIEFKSGDNPYQGRKNRLRKRQLEKRRRLMRYVKRRK